MERQDVYKIIDGERDYQDKIWNHTAGLEMDKFNSVGDFISYMDYYMTKAKEAYTTNSGNEKALDMLRKVVGLGTACFEVHGVPERIINQ